MVTSPPPPPHGACRRSSSAWCVIDLTCICLFSLSLHSLPAASHPRSGNGWPPFPGAWCVTCQCATIPTCLFYSPPWPRLPHLPGAFFAPASLASARCVGIANGPRQLPVLLGFTMIMLPWFAAVTMCWMLCRGGRTFCAVLMAFVSPACMTIIAVRFPSPHVNHPCRVPLFVSFGSFCLSAACSCAVVLFPSATAPTTISLLLLLLLRARIAAPFVLPYLANAPSAGVPLPFLSGFVLACSRFLCSFHSCLRLSRWQTV